MGGNKTGQMDEALGNLVNNTLASFEQGVINANLAFSAISMAAVGGEYPPAMYYLSQFYHLGIGCDIDEQKSLDMLERSAEGGVAEAQYRLGRSYYDGDRLSRDPGKAVRWLTEAAGQGHCDAANLLADSYLKGEGVKADREAALSWLAVAADMD